MDDGCLGVPVPRKVEGTRMLIEKPEIPNTGNMGSKVESCRRRLNFGADMGND
jgi:hypothetical protein